MSTDHNFWRERRAKVDFEPRSLCLPAYCLTARPHLLTSGAGGGGGGVIYTEVWNTKGGCKTVGCSFTKRVSLSEGSTDVSPGKRMNIMCTATDIFCLRQCTDFNIMPWTLHRVWDWDVTNPAQWKSKADRSNDCKTHQYKTTMTITILILHTHS